MIGPIYIYTAHCGTADGWSSTIADGDVFSASGGELSSDQIELKALQLVADSLGTDLSDLQVNHFSYVEDPELIPGKSAEES